MKRILISEEERSRILGMHQEKGYKPLMEQSDNKVAGGAGIQKTELKYLGKPVLLPGIKDEQQAKLFVIDIDGQGKQRINSLGDNGRVAAPLWVDYMESYMSKAGQIDYFRNTLLPDFIKKYDDYRKSPDTTSPSVNNAPLQILYWAVHATLNNMLWNGATNKDGKPATTKNEVWMAFKNDTNKYLTSGDDYTAKSNYEKLGNLKPIYERLILGQINGYLNLA